MNCPFCNRKMKIMSLLVPELRNISEVTYDVIGRCEPCDFDASWSVTENDVDGRKESDPKRYYFG